MCPACDSFTVAPKARIVERGGNEKIIPGVVPVGPRCEHCGRPHHVGGPLWTAPIHDAEFISSLLESLRGGPGAGLASAKRLTGMLTSCAEELPDVPLFQSLSHMCNVLHVTCPTTLGVASALMRQGYRVSRSHTEAQAIKTDAPNSALWDVLRCWARDSDQPARAKGLSETSPAHAILAKPPAIEADFTPHRDALALLSKHNADGGKIGKFMPTPEEWGPGSKSTSHTHLTSDQTDRRNAGGAAGAAGDLPAAIMAKRAANQGKRARKRQAREAREAAAWGEGGKAGKG